MNTLTNEEYNKRAVKRIGLVGLALIVSAIMMALLSLVRAADSVQPASCTFTNFRSQAQGLYVSSDTYFKGSTLRFTNCVLFAGTTTNSSVQQLSGCTVTVEVGNVNSNVSYVAGNTSTNLGKWSCDVTVPDWSGTHFIEVTVTDGSSHSYIYEWKTIKSKDSL